MDVNGTYFHLIAGQADWSACRLEAQPDIVRNWYADFTAGRAYEWLQVGWDDESRTLMLRPLLSLFPRGQREAPLQPSARRGAAMDRFGNWYWIGNDRQRIVWQPSGSDRPQVYWTQVATADPVPPGEFHSQTTASPTPTELAGLAVTADHYLVVGNLTQGGLFIFDLHAGGEPLLLLFPAEASPLGRFAPFDMVAAPGGGVWVLDRIHRAYWGLDRYFRVVTEQDLLHETEPAEDVAFHPIGGTATVRPSRQFPAGFPLDARNPISIEAMPDGSVLILDCPAEGLPLDPAAATSTLYHYRCSRLVSPPLPLEDDVEVVVDDEGTMRQHLSLIGHDMAYVPHEETLYVVERDGNQAIAFAVDFSAAKPLTVKRDYLPMHFFGGRALVAWGDKVFYEVAGGDPTKDAAVRWVQLQVIDHFRYQRTATLLTPVFDGKERHCIWHRLLVDACIPSETGVEVWTRAEDDRQLLEDLPFTREPGLYLRGAGAEVPYYQPFPELEQPSEATGTWELLFQQARGRYLQCKLVLTGNGRTTPQLRALRVYYPRFSYPKHYLPAVYQEDTESASFLERLLANPEGFYTEIEGKIAEVNTLFDARSAPAETLNWLASWIGLMLDPLWARIQARRRTAGQGAMKSADDRRRLFIRYALTLYSRRGTPDGIRFALHLLLHPCLEATLQRFKAAAVNPDPALCAELTRLGLPYPTAVMSEEQLEALLHDYILTPSRPSKVRIVERFLTRAGRAAAAGDPTQVQTTASSQESLQASAHRFSVLIPEGLSAEEAVMVERIIQLEKPAHTLFDVRRYWDYFRVGEARLGIDTVFGKEARFAAMVLGRDYIAEGYLSAAHPMDVAERLISDRDPLGQMPL
jgi:phage tail-like protein